MRRTTLVAVGFTRSRPSLRRGAFTPFGEAGRSEDIILTSCRSGGVLSVNTSRMPKVRECLFVWSWLRGMEGEAWIL